MDVALHKSLYEDPRPSPISDDTDNPVLHGEMAVIVIAAGGSYTEAGGAIGVSVKTIKRRMVEESFRQRVAEAGSAVVRRTAGLLAHPSVRATETLLELLDPEMPPSVRRCAARTLLGAEPDYRESDALAERLEALEARMLGSDRLTS